MVVGCNFGFPLRGTSTSFRHCLYASGAFLVLGRGGNPYRFSSLSDAVRGLKPAGGWE